MPKRFIVVDPSFTAHDGDRWNYAVNLAQAARELGYEYVLLTNRRAPDIRAALDFRIDERRVFTHTFFNHDKVYERHRAAQTDPARKVANERLMERTGALERAKSSAWERGDRLAVERLQRRITRLERRAFWLDRFRGLLRGETADLAKPFNRDDFAIALARELRRLQPGSDDRLFFHTTTYGMLESLAEVTAALDHPAPFDTQAYFLFHFGAEADDARTFLDRYYSYSAYGSIADRLAVGSPFSHLHFLATSPILRDEAERIIGAPVGEWYGLTDFQHLYRELGDPASIRARRHAVAEDIRRGELRFVARAADLDPGRARAISRACHLVQHRGNVVRLRILYHIGSLSRLRALLAEIDFPNLELVDADDNLTYIREISEAALVLLPYHKGRYEKRISAVLHDCAVLGVAAVVPADTALADWHFAARFLFDTEEDFLGATLNAVRYLQRFPDWPLHKADDLAPMNAVQRLLDASPVPSLERHGPTRIANVVMPLWGRVGSSFAMEGQVRYLLSRGFFVNQVFLLDKPVDLLASTEYFWRMLRENSRHMRGCVQRIGYWPEAEGTHGRESTTYRKAGAFMQYLLRIGRNRTDDPGFDAALRKAEISVVNHVFHSEWAFRKTGGKRVLETHDIQSYQMEAWPLLNEETGSPDSIQAMLKDEFTTVGKFDFVVNVSPEENRILSLANSRSTLITPYLPVAEPSRKYKAVWEMAWAENMHESLRVLDRFDLLIAADSHPANRESTIWFLREVFAPYLSDEHVSVALVGRICDPVFAHVGSLPHLYYLGFVDDLEAVKSLSRMAVLPDRRGTGISIKSLEAFASGMPFVGTSVAYRGLRDRLPRALRPYDSAPEMAGEILRALRDSARLEELSVLARECYAAVAGADQFDSAWDQVLSQVGIAAKDRKQEHRCALPESSPADA